jgi:hypothetical protein
VLVDLERERNSANDGVAGDQVHDVAEAPRSRRSGSS